MVKEMTAKTELILVLRLLLVLLIGIAGLSVYGLNKANDSFNSIHEDRAVPLEDLGMILDRMQRTHVNVAMLAYGRNADMAREQAVMINQQDAEINNLWQKYIATNLTSEESTLAGSFNLQWRAYAKSRNHTMALVSAEDYVGAIANLTGDAAAKFDVAHTALHKLLELYRDIAAKEYAQVRSDYESIFMIAAITIAVSMLLACVLGFLLVRGIINPWHEAITIANAVAVGDLFTRIEPHDTATGCGRSINALKEVREVASYPADLFLLTEKQASGMEETIHSTEKPASTVKQNADNMRRANELAADASAAAIKSGAVVGQVVQTMHSINESSKKIVDIVSIIDGIAFQTNILALNAAVEAARAGEQSRGFATVATEVRMLAQRSVASAKEFKELSNDFVSKTEDGVRLVDGVSAMMSETVTAVKCVTDIMSDLSATSREQNADAKQGDQAMSLMDEVAQQSTTLTQEAAAVDSEREQGQELIQAVNTFRPSCASSNITATPVTRSNRPPASAQLRGSETKEVVEFAVDSVENYMPASIQSRNRKVAMGGKTNDWEEF